MVEGSLQDQQAAPPRVELEEQSARLEAKLDRHFTWTVVLLLVAILMRIVVHLLD